MKKFVVVLVLALVAVACGGDGDGGENDAIVQAIAEGITSEPDAPLTMDEAECTARALVDDWGVDRIIELGLDAEANSPDFASLGLTNSEVDGLADSIFDCVDNFVGKALAQDGAFSAADSDCIGRELDQDAAKGMIVSGMLGSEPTPDQLSAMLDAFSACDIDLGG